MTPLSFEGWTDEQRAQWAWEQEVEAARVQFESWLLTRRYQKHGGLMGALAEGERGGA